MASVRQPERTVIACCVGTCGHCGGNVLLHGSFLSREARCGCGATVITASFLAFASGLARWVA